MFTKQLEIKNFLYNKNNIEGKKFILKENLLDFDTTSNVIPAFFDCLWADPKLVADLLRHCDIKDIKGNLANLFVNNFYTNILSNNYVENNLMFVLTSLIKDEIDNLKNIDEYDNFMSDDSKVGYFMNELRKNDDIKCFFKTSFLNIISDLESMSNLNLNLDEQEIIDILKADDFSEDDYTWKLDYLDDIINQYIPAQEMTELKHELFTQKNYKEIMKQKNIEKFNTKYLKILPLSELEKIKSTFGENNPEMNDYLNNIIEIAKDDGYYYSNSYLMTQFQANKMFSSKLIILYMNKFFIIKNILDKFISSLEQNLDILPYYVKCICKIISVLIQKKFGNISTDKKSMFISKFFYIKLILPILVNPEIELLINNFIISGNTLPNMKIIYQILYKLFSFKFFINNSSVNNNMYTPFNWYILDKMPQIFEIFNKLTDIDLPPFINDFINDKLEPNFSYDYFLLNKDESIMHKTICFTKQDLNSLLNAFTLLSKKKDITLYKNGAKILVAYKKLLKEKNKNSTTSSLDCFTILENDIEDNNKQKELYEYNYENYYLLQNLNINNEFKEVFNLDLKEKNNFFIKEIKIDNNKENSTKNLIIKFKNFLSDLLYKMGPLKISDLYQCKISNTNDILNSIKKYAKLSYNVVDDSIPPEWYAMTLLDLIKDIPEEYSKNDFEKLFDELEDEINISINKFNIDFLLDCLDKIKYLEKYKKNVENYFEILKDLELNEKVKQIVINDYIPIQINLNFNNKNFSFDITKSKLKKDECLKIQSKEKSKNLKQYKKHCYSIQSFIDNFPNFLLYQGEKNLNVLEIQKKFNVPEKLKQYVFSIIHEHLKNNKKIDNQIILIQTENKIYDYIMSKINLKIFPQDDVEDNKLYKNELMLSWVKPEHLMKGKKDYIIDIFLPDVTKFFNSLENNFSPRKKIENINNIFKFILQIIEFNRNYKKDVGIDDQFPILCYCFIKIKMSKFLSNLKFIELYRNSLINKVNESELVQLFAVCKLLLNIKYDNLHGITKEEFDKNCKKNNN